MNDPILLFRYPHLAYEDFLKVATELGLEIDDWSDNTETTSVIRFEGATSQDDIALDQLTITHDIAGKLVNANFSIFESKLKAPEGVIKQVFEKCSLPVALSVKAPSVELEPQGYIKKSALYKYECSPKLYSIEVLLVEGRINFVEFDVK